MGNRKKSLPINKVGFDLFRLPEITHTVNGKKENTEGF